MAMNPGGHRTNNIFIPQGLLRSVNETVYAYSRRDETGDDREAHTLSDLLERPAQAVLSTAPLERSRTPEFGPTGRPQIRLGKTSISQTNPGQGNRPVRAASINVATLLRSKRNHSRQQFLAIPEDQQQIFSFVPNPTRPSDRAGSVIPPRQTWSPTPQPGRISSHHPSEIPLHHRLDSFVPGPDSITVRRPTRLSLQPRLSILDRTGSTDSTTPTKATRQYRQTSIRNTFEHAKIRQEALQRSKSFQIVFQYAMYLLILACVYFVLVGRPLWGGIVWYIYLLFEYHLTFVGGSAVFVGLAFFYAFGPLLIFLEEPAPQPPPIPDAIVEKPYFPPAPFIRCFEEAKPPQPPEKKVLDGSATTALLIPCYKSAGLLPATLESALKIFPATSIYILANGNSPTPLDNTEEVCTKFGVNHIWIPVGSKIVAQYVGAHVVRHLFPHVLLIDDDCLLPSNFPVVTDRLRGTVKCLGYTLASIGENRSRGTWCQQAQDLEYKLSGLQRAFAGKIGSATFPHGAIVLWDTEFLVLTFKHHPGFSVSEDWFFGHVARILGSRIVMCSSVFVETETPSSVFFAARGGARGGFGEMTVFKQRFKRWNFFFVNGCYYNLAYILFSWRLGIWEIGTKMFVFQEVYETFLYLITPIVLPISFFVRPTYSAYLFAGTLALYLLNSMIFNEVHLRRAGQMVSRRLLLFYYMPFKLALTFVNVASCWWSLWQYAKYFAKKHPRIVEDVGAVGVVLKIEEDLEDEEAMRKSTSTQGDDVEPADHSEDDRQGSLRRSGATRTKKVTDDAEDDKRRNQPVRTNTQRSGISERSATGSIRRPRRLTVTAVKVAVQVEGPSSTPQTVLQESSDTGDRAISPSTQAQSVVATDGLSLGLPRTTSLSGGVFGQLTSWVPNWASSGDGDLVSGHRGADVMEQVVEAENEDDEFGLGGYSYYA